MHGYKQIEHTADIAIEVYADSIENLFRAGAEAWLDLSIRGDKFTPAISQKVEMHGESYEELLVVFLSELNFQLHVFKKLFSSVSKISLWKEGDEYFIDAEILGEEIDYDKFYIKEEIKAVTFHQVEIIFEKELYSTKIIFDI